jgi:flagellar biosynthesis protein FliQ
MNEHVFLELLRETMFLSLKITIPILGTGMLVGVMVSIFQTATSIQDQSLSFIPKLFATIGAILVLGPWILTNMLQFAHKLLSGLQAFAR